MEEIAKQSALQIPSVTDMDSFDSEKMTHLLSILLDMKYTRPAEEVEINRNALLIEERILSNKGQTVYTLGSTGEGLKLAGSDQDVMLVNTDIIVMYPDERITTNMKDKTILYMRKARSRRPGYVNLQLHQTGRKMPLMLFNSFLSVNGLWFASSDIYREQLVFWANKEMDLDYISNGPSSSNTILTTDVDYVSAFPCNSWPREAKEWVTRTRLFGWPSQTLIDKIVRNGCQVVPVGDKCSKETGLQWRISFATSERYLIHSFNHTQLKVYSLLKYFLKQIKKTLKDVIGDDDILCSYFLKTTVFHAIENSKEMFWQNKHCLWFCFNILIAWVKAGFCPNYFLPANNLFKRKVHGLHQQILLDILANFYQMKWACLSVGNFFQPTIWKDLCDPAVQSELEAPKPVQGMDIHKDVAVHCCLRCMTHVNRCICICANRETIRYVLQLLAASQTEFEEVYTYTFAMRCLQTIASNQVFPNHKVATSSKARYRRLRKCRRWMIPGTTMGTEILYLATFHFLTGDLPKALEMCKEGITIAWLDFPHVTSSAEKMETFSQRYPYHRDMYNRQTKMYANDITFQKNDKMCLPHLYLELLQCARSFLVPSLHYGLFLSFLCCHEMGDTRGRDVALCRLKDVQYHEKDGGHMYWIVHTLVGICYQTLGDYHRAIKAYWESAQSQGYGYRRNPAITRVAVAYLCMYV
ncbi:uncharacterized protein [Argopecten irradians]|uniref:uncharacterized protein n=1 Tax=Argopecten irradians TaxID=31199 RepID=UPI003719548B